MRSNLLRIHSSSPVRALVPLLLVVLLLVSFFLILSSATAPLPGLSEGAESVRMLSASPEMTAPLLAKQRVVALLEKKAEPDPQLLAEVNGQRLYATDLSRAVSIDKTLAGLLGQKSTAIDEAVLGRLVNQTLLLQKAQQMGIQVVPATADNRLTQFLSQAGVDQSVLKERLAEAQVLYPDFLHYYTQLLIVEQMGAQTSLAVLQQQAHISFGPQAAAFFVQEAVANQVNQIKTTVQADFPAGVEMAVDKIEPAPAMSIEVPTISLEPDIRGTAPGTLAPEFSLPRVQLGQNNSEGGLLTFDDLAGQPTVLSFWTTWCPFCRRQTPILVDAYHRYTDTNLQFVGINVKESSEIVLPYLEEHQIPYINGLDAGGAVANDYLVRGFPTTYFLDSRGAIVARHVGELSQELLDVYINRLNPQKVIDSHE